MERIICIGIGYIFGLFQTGYIYGKLKHVDIRNYGSGNAGTTNAMRVLGKKAGIVTYIGDCLKAVIASLLICLIFRNESTSFLFILKLYGGLGVILGHNFPFYMGFKGGKGIAASSGVILGLWDFKLSVIALITFVLVTAISKYVSVGSLTMMAGFFIEFIIFNELELLGFKNNMHFAGNRRIEVYLLVFVISALAFVKHRTNIKRLIDGNERKIGQKKKELKEEIS